MIGKIKGHGARKTWWIDGAQVSQAEFEIQFPSAQATGKAGDSLVGFKPLHSEGLAVHPKQIAEARANAVAKGIPTEFDKKGRPIFTSRKHRKEYCKAYGYFDRDAGYGDAAPGDRKGGVVKEDVQKSYGSLLEASQAPQRGDLNEALRAVMRRHGL